MNNIPVSIFVQIYKDELDKFEKFWNDNQEKVPEQFPDFLNEGDWLEQFLIYLDTTDPENIENSMENKE